MPRKARDYLDRATKMNQEWIVYCITQNFQCNVNLCKQAQKTFRCYLILGMREVVQSTLRSFCTVLRTNELILRILDVTIN